MRTKLTKTVKLATAGGSPTRVGGDATLGCVREGRGCNVKFLDADVQRPLASASAVADGKRMWSISGLKNLIFYGNLGASTTLLIHTGLVPAGIWEHNRGCLPNPEIEDQRASGRHARQE